jgi:hypothetical protein
MAVLQRTNKEHEMPGNPREMVTMAERSFPVRVRIAVPPGGLGHHAQMTAWLDENCGSDGWTMTPSGTRGVLNDATSIYFADATLASAFVARWCVGSKVETAGGVFCVREDDPTPRVGQDCIGRREGRSRRLSNKWRGSKERRRIWSAVLLSPGRAPELLAVLAHDRGGRF